VVKTFRGDPNLVGIKVLKTRQKYWQAKGYCLIPNQLTLDPNTRNYFTGDNM